MSFFQVGSSELSVQPDTLFEIGNYPITNSMTAGLLVTFVLVLFCIALNLGMKKNSKPTKIEIFAEMLYMAFLGFVEQIAGDKKLAKKILPLIGTIFLYIGVSALITLLPGITSINVNDMALFRTHTNDFNTTFGMALSMVVIVQLATIKKFGILSYINRYIRVGSIIDALKGRKSVVMAVIDIPLGLLDIISELAKSISLSLRLFGNMFAGELLALLVMSSFGILAPIPLIFFNMFAGIVQALVFGALTAAYFGIALKEE